MTAKTQKADATLRCQVLLLFDAAFILILKCTDSVNLKNLATVNKRGKLSVLKMLFKVALPCYHIGWDIRLSGFLYYNLFFL